MQITINGQKENLPSPINIQSYLEKRKTDLTGLVIEINEKILNKNDWPTTILQENDVVELITFMGGG